MSAAAGIKHSVALASDGSLFTWGDGSRGQLGHSSLHSMSTAGVSSNIKLLLPQKITRLDPAGLTPENRCVMLQMMLCLLLRTTRKRLAFYCYAWLRHVKWHYPRSLCRITATAAGNYHSLALTVGGSILGFGANDAGQLGLGDFVDHWKPTRVNLACRGEEGTCLRAVQLACGSQHTVALISKQGYMEVRTAGEPRTSRCKPHQMFSSQHSH